MELSRIIPTWNILPFFIALLVVSGQVNASESDKKSSYRIIHNNDGTDALGNYWFHKRPLCVADLNAYVDMVSNSQVTTFMMCSGSDFPYYRSKYNRLFCDDKNGTLTCGNDTASYRNFKKFYTNFLNLEKEGTDLIAASLNRAKKNGMEAFITYRMNDLHFNDTTSHCPLLYTDFWYNHPQYWINDGTPGFNASRALDFAHKEVRAHKLAMITEQLQKYDMIDGFDLDFMRFIVYFKQGQGRKNAPLMTQLVKDIRAKVDSVSARRGKKILLSVRVPPTIEICIDKGLDIQEWIRLKLVDFVSIGVHWRGDPSLPVAKFRKELGAPNIPIYASIDDGGYRQRETYSHGMLRGMASHILAQGADGLYLFNQYYGEYNSKYNGNIHPEEGGQICRVNAPSLLKEMGSLKTLEYRNKIYCLNDSSGEYGMVPVSPLPLQVSANVTAKADIFVGDNPAKTIPKEAILFLRTNHLANFDLQVNGIAIANQKSEYVQLYDRTRGLQKGEQEYAFIVPAKCLKQGYNTITFKEKDSNAFRIKRLEIALKYGEVETNGYF